MTTPPLAPSPTPAFRPSPVAVMRRNVWVEIGVYTLVSGLLLLGFGRWQGLTARSTTALLALTVPTLLYHYQQLKLLRRLQTGLAQLGVAQQLRQLLHLGRWISLALAGGGMVVVLLPPALLVTAASHWPLWVGLAASIGLAYGAVRWHQWQAYGRHLTQLETSWRAQLLKETG